MDVDGGGGLGRRGLSKFTEILRRPRGEADSISESPDLDFVYDDSDKYEAEIAELYSYTEECELFVNKKCFDDTALGYLSDLKWMAADEYTQHTHVMRLLNTTEVSDRQSRMRAVRALLYLCQGAFGECYTEEQHSRNTRHNVFLLYECGAFNTFVQLLNMEVENCMAASAAIRKPAVSLADSTDLRILLNVMYTMVETLRWPNEAEPDQRHQRLRENFRNDLIHPMSEGEETLAVILFGMVTKFCSGTAPHFPMKKVLLLLWKVVLVSVGGLSDIHSQKNQKRLEAGLPLMTEDTHQVCKHMRASSPPASAADLIEQHQQIRRTFRGTKKGLMKQTSLEDPFDGGADSDDISSEIDTGRGSDEDLPPTPPRPSTPLPAKGLPWTPKVRQKDLETFLDHTRSKFVGFNVKNDNGSLAGLPLPIHEGVKVLNQHLYVSLTELQIKREEEIAKNPLSKAEKDIPETAAELLYQAMFPSLPQYMIAMLKILLAAAPTSKAKTESVNILADLLPEEMPTTVLQSMKLGIDVNRHKEIIVKAISGLLLLILKHFKLNHVYQFEYMSQHLVFANCIPLVLKFFNQNISSYVSAKNMISIIDFPSCIIGDHQELTAENLEAGDNQQYCWRNLFSCINLLRMLNKLTKWKHSRTMMLVVFKSAPILKRALKVKHAMMQLYILKLLKMQTKYLGRQWRKSNMKTMSAIYQKVRHRLTDDWAYGNDMDARPWDFQAEECALRACVDRFNNRRYGSTSVNPDFEPVDNCIHSVLGRRIELNEEFKSNYERWLEVEVFSNQIDWDQIICH